GNIPKIRVNKNGEKRAKTETEGKARRAFPVGVRFRFIVINPPIRITATKSAMRWIHSPALS
ncbi:hypothetical protein MRY87_09910, partial [bacterium]|nr:hypothetical protein [bacterium]